MKPTAHIITSGLISILAWSYFGSIWCALISFISGVVIDADHFFDYYMNRRFTLKKLQNLPYEVSVVRKVFYTFLHHKIKDIYYTCLEANLKKLYLLFHSYELVGILWLLIYILSLNNLWKAMAIGVTQHMIFDQLTNPINAYGYFISYRIAVGFKKERLFKENGRDL